MRNSTMNDTSVSIGDRQQQDERAEDRRRGDDERQEGQERAEHEREHEQRADRAEQGLAEHARTAVALVAGRERVFAGDSDGCAGRFGRVGRRADRVGGQHSGRRRVEPVEHERVGRPVVLRRAERLVAGVRLVDYAQMRVRLGDGVEGLRDLGLVAGDRLPRRHRDRHDVRAGVTAVAEQLLDLGCGLGAGLPGQREVDREPVRHGARDGSAAATITRNQNADDPSAMA